MRKNPRRILSPQRLPFRHPGTVTTNLTNRKTYCNTATRSADCAGDLVSVVVLVGAPVGACNRSTAANVCFGAR
jgi:hypothetical protein